MKDCADLPNPDAERSSIRLSNVGNSSDDRFICLANDYVYEAIIRYTSSYDLRYEENAYSTMLPSQQGMPFQGTSIIRAAYHPAKLWTSCYIEILSHRFQ